LQVIAEQGVENWTDRGGMSRQEPWCRQYLVSHGVLAEKANAIIDHASLAIENCLASVQGRWVLGKHEDARCEYRITAVLGKVGGGMFGTEKEADPGQERPRNLILDRTFIESGTRWIIDYKTSSHAGSDLEGFLNNEASRYREQLLRYKNALSITESRPIKTALYFPLLDRLVELE
jgi:ATP-dependent exoDNAse (exonuclease V) beta subunit